jgi:hypothetical protein
VLLVAATQRCVVREELFLIASRLPCGILIESENNIPRSAARMPKIDIDGLTEEDLIELNQKVVARLRFLREMRSHVQMLDFRIGERVRFTPEGRPEVFGFITRYNKKSVTIIADNGGHWRVHPGFLTKAVPAEQSGAGRAEGSVIAFQQPEPGKRRG